MNTTARIVSVRPDAADTTEEASPAAHSLLHDERGAELIEKLVMIALFIFVAVVGLKYLGDKVDAKFQSQGDSIEAAEDQLPN